MPFRGLDSHLTPEELAELGRAFDGICEELGIKRDGGAEPEREKIAKLILKLAGQGEIDAKAVRLKALAELGAPLLSERCSRLPGGAVPGEDRRRAARLCHRCAQIACRNGQGPHVGVTACPGARR